MDNPLFQNVYVINMDKDKERLRAMYNNLSKYNIKFTRVSAIHGKNISEQEIKSHTTSLCRHLTCTKGYIGSGLTHMYLWNMVSKSKDKWHLILEDDVEFSNKSINLFNNLALHLQENPHIDALINVNCHNPYEAFCRAESQSDVLSFNLLAGGASAYLITPSSAKKLLDLTKGKVSCAIDLYWASFLHGDNPRYLITKKRYVKHDFNLYHSQNVQINIMPILSYILSFCGGEELAFLFNTPIVTVNMSYEIKPFLLIFILLFILNIIKFKNIYIYLYLTLEFIIYLLLLVKKK